MFSIASDRARRLIEISYDGFIDMEAVSASFSEEQRHVAAMGCRSLEHRLLIDARALAVLTQDVVAHVLSSLEARPLRACRAAVITGSALSQLQVKRMAAQESDVQIFTTREPAMSWLLAAGA